MPHPQAMYYVYMLTNKWKNVLYTGMTDSIENRLRNHKNGRFDGFTKRYNCTNLVYYETMKTADEAIIREQELKGWTRAKKNALLESVNPEWDDVSATVLRK